jgi:signal transduction histidine kinase
VAHAEQVPQVRLDPDRIHKVLGTLLTNAIHLSSTGGTLILSTRLARACVEIRLTEEGPCLPKDRQSEAFTLQEAALNGDRNPASGLGQAIALRIVEAHGGSLRTESHEGVGTTFVLSLPSA